MSNTKNSFNMSALNSALLPNDDRADKKLIGDVLEDLSPVVMKRGEALKEIQSQHDELKANFLEERAALETKYQKIYEIVNGVAEAEGVTEAGTDQEKDKEKGVPDFWLNAIRNNDIVSEELSECDEGALKYLKDIKWARMDNPKGFKLEFFFDTNPYFKNDVLTKIYYLIDENEPILDKALGMEIEWYPGKCLTQKILKKKPKNGSKNAEPITKTEMCSSFFNFFNPPKVPKLEDIDEDIAEELQNSMDYDYDVGSTIWDKIIPQAVLWFTGEADQDYGDFYDDEDEGIDEEEDEEDDEEDDEDESKTRKKTLHLCARCDT